MARTRYDMKVIDTRKLRAMMSPSSTRAYAFRNNLNDRKPEPGGDLPVAWHAVERVEDAFAFIH
jgi:hypothetical protein